MRLVDVFSCLFSIQKAKKGLAYCDDLITVRNPLFYSGKKRQQLVQRGFPDLLVMFPIPIHGGIVISQFAKIKAVVVFDMKLTADSLAHLLIVQDRRR